jgi:DNA-binding MarR family transcriptional regulator
VLKAVGLTHVQFVLLAVLSWLSQQQAGVTQVQLAQHSYVDVMMTSQVLRTLEEKGLVKRLTHPSDARAKSVQITDRGSDVVARAISLVESADQAFFSNLPDLSEFTGSLRRLLQNDREGE